jgi:hypothetical protein
LRGTVDSFCHPDSKEALKELGIEGKALILLELEG